MAWFAVEEDGQFIGWAEGASGSEPGGYDDPRFRLTKVARPPDEDDEFVDGKVRKRPDASARRERRGRRIRALEDRVADLEDKLAELLAARPA